MKKRRLSRRMKACHATTLTLCATCASITFARNADSDSAVQVAQNFIDPPSEGAPEIMRLEGGKLVTVERPPSRHRFGISYRPVFNLSAEFKGVGFPSSSVPGPGAGIVDRIYDDGYVRPETTGLAAGSPDGYTSYWSYQNAGQVVGNNLLMSSASSAGSTASSGAFDDGPQNGFEMDYSWVGGPLGPFMWGLEGGFGFSGVNFRDDRSFVTDVSVTTDTYDVSNLAAGGGPPPAPGTPSTGRSGTSALILVEPASRSIADFSGSTITGSREIDANVFDLRIGPYAEYSFTDRFSVGLGAGLALAYVNSSFDLQESLSLPGGGMLRNSGSSVANDTLVGGYISANLAYTFNNAWRVFGGAQYRNLGTFEQTVDEATVTVDFRNAIYALVGVGYSF